MMRYKPHIRISKAGDGGGETVSAEVKMESWATGEWVRFADAVRFAKEIAGPELADAQLILERDEARAELAAARAGGNWCYDMATAPRDGRALIAIFGHCGNLACIYCDPNDTIWRRVGSREEASLDFYAWMRPAPPSLILR